MLAELYAYHYDDLRRDGRAEDELEDEGFNLDETLREMADDWEDVQQ